MTPADPCPCLPGRRGARQLLRPAAGPRQSPAAQLPARLPRRPPGYLHAISPERLAVLSGRTAAVLERTLTGLIRPARDAPGQARHGTRAADKPGLFAAIRRNAQDGHSIRALAARHRVHRRTIRQALGGPVPLPRKTPQRTSVLDRLHDPMMAMLTAEPGLPRPAGLGTPPGRARRRRLLRDGQGLRHAPPRASPAREHDRRPAYAAARPGPSPPHHHQGARLRRTARAEEIHREPAALEGLHGHIDAMLEANPEIATAAIWERLADENATTVAYPALRTYVSRRAVRKHLARKATADLPSPPWRAQVLTAA